VNVNTALELVGTGAHNSYPTADVQGDRNGHDKSRGEMIEWEEPGDELDVDPGEPIANAPSGGLTGVDILGSFPVLGAVDDDEVPDWQERALCAQTDPEAFFPEKGGSTREAKRICSGCEVRAECLDYALAHDERFGIWGGLSERERRRLRRAAG
jgi:WhiB family redox-sensing transcriptional regulator